MKSEELRHCVDYKNQKKQEAWNIKQSKDIYRIEAWSEGYIDINKQGNLVVSPNGKTTIDLPELSQQLKQAGLNLPILVRFSDILKDRVDRLINSFHMAMQSYDYNANYTAAYPVKVNQQRRVIEDIVAAGNGHVGLEAGSKPELLIVIALASPDSTIICNGYKDQEYIKLALIAKQLGFKTYIVIEKLSELKLLIECANEIRIKPLLGLRIRLTSMAKGNWQNTGGEKSKFGLHTNQILQAIEILKKDSLLESLKLLHFHIGSQVTKLEDFKTGLNEGVRYYAELKKQGVSINTLDIGGGLAIDYEGTQSDNLFSMDYSIYDYAETMIETVQSVCKSEQLDTPSIITESGRAMTAHHAMLITNVIDIEQAISLTDTSDINADIVNQLKQLNDNCHAKTVETDYKTNNELFNNARIQFTNGELNLKQWAQAEECYYENCKTLLSLIDNDDHDLLNPLREKLADKVFCNFSVFQTMPDTWAIDQIFPIIPLQRLDEKPERRCTIQDMTCDSDGRIDYYVNAEGIETSLPIHYISKDEEYLIGIFLLGAYQEILGDIHNLFGDSASVNVELDDEGNVTLSEIDKGDKISDLFQTIHIDTEQLKQKYQQLVNASPINQKDKTDYLEYLVDGLDGYTYLEIT